MAQSNDSAIAGDGTRFGCVLKAWQTHEAELLGYLRHQTGDEHLAEDLLQEIFVKAMRHGEAFCGLEQPRGWLFQVARNALVDAARRRRPTVELDEDVPSPEVSEPVAVDELADCIDRTLPALDPADQDVIRRCDLEGLTVQGYADATGLSLPAAKARLRRARIRLRSALVSRCGVRFDARGKVCCAVGARPT